jgi:hypothetical protein
MHRFATIAFVVAGLVGAESSVRAQEPPALLAGRRVDVPAAPIVDLSREQELELGHWLDAMDKWRRRSHGSQNSLAHDLKGSIVSRRPQPPAPAWLSTECRPFDADSAMLTGRFGDACRLLAVLTGEIAADALHASIQAARAHQEKPERSSFFSRLHLDGLWLNPSTQEHAYGLLGSHISLVDVGRVQVFGPPGVLLVRVPTGPTTHETRLGYTWGFSVRLMDVRLLGPTRNATLFISVTKCWTAGSGSPALADPGFDLVGFSLAPRKRR